MTHEALIDQWPSVADFARDLDVNYQTARFMKKRNSIHPRHWRKVVQAAKSRGIRGVNIDMLERSAPYAESVA
jgi:hypothetical protein